MQVRSRPHMSAARHADQQRCAGQLQGMQVSRKQCISDADHAGLLWTQLRTTQVNCGPRSSAADYTWQLRITRISCEPRNSGADYADMLWTVHISCGSGSSAADRAGQMRIRQVICGPCRSAADNAGQLRSAAVQEMSYSVTETTVSSSLQSMRIIHWLFFSSAALYFADRTHLRNVTTRQFIISSWWHVLIREGPIKADTTSTKTLKITLALLALFL